jgi:hypothetical protein
MTSPRLQVVPKPIEVDMDLYRDFWSGRDENNGMVRMAVEDMVRSGIAPDQLHANGIKLWSGDRNDLLKIMGRTKIDGQSIISTSELAEFPVCDEHGIRQYSRFRLYPPVQDFKYLQPVGIPAMPWIPAKVWKVKEKNNSPLWITEGEKKALKLVQHGENAISLPGVWNFKAGAKDDRADWQDKEMWGCLRDFTLAGRTVFLAFDVDMWTNPGVRFALYELAVKLYSRGAVVRIAQWSGGKGIDDHLFQAPFVDSAISNVKEMARDIFDFILKDHLHEVIRAVSRVELSPVLAEQLENSVSKALNISRHALRKEINHRREKNIGVPDFVEGLNKKYALIHGLSEVWDCEGTSSMKVDAFKHLIPFESKRWLENTKKRIVKREDIVFEPQGAGDHQINLFKGWPLVPDIGKPHQKLVDHVLHLSDYDEETCHWLTCWLAWPLQNPGAKMATAVVIHGAQGTGKNILFDAVLNIYGDYGDVVDQKTIESDFTGWLSRKLMMVADEVVSNLQQVQVKNRIKGLVTGATSWINRKGIEPRVEANHCNLVFLSNEDVPLLIDSDDRRFCVIRCDKVESKDYYKQIAEEIEAGGAAGLYAYLLNYSCEGFDGAHAKPLMTEAKKTLGQLCERTPEKFIRAWRAEEVPVNCMTTLARQIYALYVIWCSETNEHAVTECRFGRIMSKSYLKKHTRKGTVYQILKDIEELTDEDVEFFQKKMDDYRRSVIGNKAK